MQPAPKIWNSGVGGGHSRVLSPLSSCFPLPALHTIPAWNSQAVLGSCGTEKTFQGEFWENILKPTAQEFIQALPAPFPARAGTKGHTIKSFRFPNSAQTQQEISELHPDISIWPLHHSFFPYCPRESKGKHGLQFAWSVLPWVAARMILSSRKYHAEIFPFFLSFSIPPAFSDILGSTEATITPEDLFQVLDKLF